MSGAVTGEVSGTPRPDALVALGSNLGDSAAHLRAARRALAELGTVHAASSLWRTAPVGGPAGQDDYLNAVVRVAPLPELRDPAALLGALLAIERARGRRRRERWGPRTLDLDLLDVGGAVRSEADLRLPHPRMLERAFVLAPLLEVAPEWRHPASGTAARAAWAALPADARAAVERTDLRWGAAGGGPDGDSAVDRRAAAPDRDRTTPPFDPSDGGSGGGAR